MNARVLSVVVLLACVAVLAFWWQGGTPAVSPATPKTETRPSPTVASGDLVGGAERTEVTETPAAVKAAASVRVEVVTSSGQPAVGATVRYWPPAMADHREHARLIALHGNDAEAALLAHGQVAIADRAGVVEILPAPGSDVCARLAEDYGQIDLWDHNELLGGSLRIQLMGDVRLEVEIVDRDGRAVPDRMITVAGTFLSQLSGVNEVSESYGPSDVDGKVVVSHLLWRLDIMGKVFDGGLEVYGRRQEGRGWDTPSIRIASQRVAHDELHGVVKVRLVEPVGGAIEVRVVDAAGKAVEEAVRLERADGSLYQLDPTAYDGKCIFAGVPLGRSWRAIASFAGDDYVGDVRGPVAAGERVSLDVRVPARYWRFTARMVNADGQVLARQPLLFAPVEPHPFLDWSKGSRYVMDTDAEGRFAFHAWVPEAMDTLPGLSLKMHVDGSFKGVCCIDRVLSYQDSDLGDLVASQVGPEQLIAAVTFTSGGAPLSGASVTLTQESEFGRHAVKATPQVRGNVVELRGRLAHHSRLSAVCACAGYLAKEVELLPGARVSVDLQRAESLRVRLACADLPMDGVGVELRSLDGGKGLRRRDVHPEQQVCEWSGQLSGSYMLRVDVHGTLLHEEPVVVHDGQNFWPSKHERFDLAGRVQGIYVFARSAATQQHVDVECLLVPRACTELPDDGEGVETWFPLRDTRPDLLVRAWGYTPVRVPSPTKNLSLQLQPLTTLKLQQPATPYDLFRVRIIEDGLRDPVLRAYAEQTIHDEEFEFDIWTDGTVQQDFIPGTVLELTPIRNNTPAPKIQVTIGTTSPQTVRCQAQK